MSAQMTAFVGKLGFIMRLDKAVRLRLSVIAACVAILPYFVFYFFEFPNAKFLCILVGFAIYIYGHHENADNVNITKTAITFIIASVSIGMFEDRFIVNKCIYNHYAVTKAQILDVTQGRGYANVTYKFCYKGECVENLETISKSRSLYKNGDICYVDFNYQNLRMSHIYPKDVKAEKTNRRNVVIFSWKHLDLIYKIVLSIVILAIIFFSVYFLRKIKN